MKKTYIQPTMLAVKLQQTQMLCESDAVTTIDSNAGVGYGGGSNNDPTPTPGGRVKEQNVWDEEW